MIWTLTTLEVANLEKSLQFYCEALGMPLIERFSAGPGTEIAMLGEKEAVHLELLCKSGAARESMRRQGFSIGFEVPDAAGLAARLDGDFIGPIAPNPSLRFYFVRDPDGYQIQLIEKPD